MTSSPVLEVVDLRTHLFTSWGVVKAVDGVSFSVDAGQALGLVGESGSGKSITALSILQLLPKPAGRIVEGRILLDGTDLVGKTEPEMTRVRGKQVSMILQDPMNSLNPVLSVLKQVGEGVALHHGLRGRARRDRAAALLTSVGIAAPFERLRSFPHQLSGGMRQRVVGAMAITAPPRLLIADEPTTSLDVTVQAQYLRMLKALQQRHRLAMVFITHDLGIVARMCERVAVMYAGRLVEAGNVAEIFERPAHPYTRALLDAVPRFGAREARLAAIDGQPPDPAALPAGCAFAPRCSEATDACRDAAPPETIVAADHRVRCWRRSPL